MSPAAPPEFSVTAPVLSELAIVGSSSAAMTLTVEAIATVTESSPELSVPPLSCSVVIVITRSATSVGL